MPIETEFLNKIPPMAFYMSQTDLISENSSQEEIKYADKLALEIRNIEIENKSLNSFSLALLKTLIALEWVKFDIPLDFEENTPCPSK